AAVIPLIVRYRRRGLCFPANLMRNEPMSRSRMWALLALTLLLPVRLQAAEPFRYPEGKHGKGEMKYINDLPVLQLEGKPAELGEQMAILTAQPAGKLLNYPKDFLKLIKLEFAWPLIVNMGKGLLPHFPPDHLQEMESGVKAAK